MAGGTRGVILREATPEDWPRVAEFFLATPLQSGTSFVLDRRPDFGALPALRGRFRTFLALDGRRIAGTVTALWRPGRDGSRQITVGEVMDLRVVSWAQGGPAAFQLLRAAHAVFVAERADWIVCLIGRHNQATIPLVAQRCGFPLLEPLEEFASVHFVAARVPRWGSARGIVVRAAQAADAAQLAELCAADQANERLAPTEPISWPDRTGQHRAWLASAADGTPCGALLTWDGDAVRRMRIVRYRNVDLPLRLATAAAAALGMANPLPAPGGVLGLWATRLVSVRSGGAHTLRALLDAALAAAVDAGRSVLQLNLRARDPLLRRLPPYPRSTYWSTLYGGPCEAARTGPRTGADRYHVDLARV
jgi:hypothetical protein